MVTCWNCMCDGPRASTEAEAIADWNARPSPWIACSELMPEAVLYVLASVLGGDLHVAKCRNGFWFDWRLYDHAVTHWMPLPKEPDEKKRTGQHEPLDQSHRAGPFTQQGGRGERRGVGGCISIWQLYNHLLKNDPYRI